METSMEKVFQEKEKRLIDAMQNEKPDRVPLRIYAAEFCAKYVDYSIQEVTHDFEKAFFAVRKCAKDFKWDGTLTNPIYVWTGFVEQIGLKYFKVPGIDLPPNIGFQYLEPDDEESAFMHEDEYDLLIESPTEFLASIWLPRVSKYFVPPGSKNTYENNMAWLKGGMSMLYYDYKNLEQVELMKEDSGTVASVIGILIAPMDIIANKLRGFKQLCIDIYRRPDKVLAACRALQPYLLQNALYSSDPERKFPIGLWLHRGNLFSDKIFEEIYWPTLKDIVEELWRNKIQTLWYAEGDWGRWIDYVKTLPEKSIIYHVDKEDIFEVHKKIGDKFCLSGGIPNDMLAFSQPEEIKEYCRKVIKVVAKEGGYMLDACGAIQQDAKIENVRAITDAALEYGIY